MATWNDLRNYIYSKYKVNDESPGLISLVFRFDDGRTQIVFVSHQEMNLSREQWVQIESPIAHGRAVNLWPVLERISGYVVGGLSVAGNYLTLRHAVPLADMSVEEFESPLDAVVTSADGLEATLSRVDAL